MGTPAVLLSELNDGAGVSTEDTEFLNLNGFLDTTNLTELRNGDGIGVVTGTDFISCI